MYVHAHKINIHFIVKGLKKVAPEDTLKKIDLSVIDKLKHDYLVKPKQDREARFIYASKDLQTITEDKIVRIDFTIDIG